MTGKRVGEGELELGSQFKGQFKVSFKVFIFKKIVNMCMPNKI